MPDPGFERPPGLFGSLKAAGATLLAILHTRLELFTTELEEEKVRLGSILVWSLVALFCAGLGIVFVALFLVRLLWDTNPLLALGIPAVLFLTAGALACRVVIRKVRQKPRLFAATLAEFEKDREQLISRHE
jgi:uncharacterized membrane protein YqjE